MNVQWTENGQRSISRQAFCCFVVVGTLAGIGFAAWAGVIVGLILKVL